MQKAATHGPFAIVTLGAELKQEITRNAELYGYSDLLAEVRILPWTVAEVSSNLDKYREGFRYACQSFVDERHVSAIIIGVALTGIASAIGTELSIPIYDGIQSAFRFAKSPFYGEKLERCISNIHTGYLAFYVSFYSALPGVTRVFKRDEGNFGCRSVGAMLLSATLRCHNS